MNENRFYIEGLVFDYECSFDGFIVLYDLMTKQSAYFKTNNMADIESMIKNNNYHLTK